MKIILHLKKQIEEEFEDAEKYICCATRYRSDYPELANTYHKLSTEECSHASELYAQMVELMEHFKKTKSPPEALIEMWDDFKEDYIHETARIKMMQDIYKMNK